MKNYKIIDLSELNKLLSSKSAREFVLYSGNNAHLSPHNIDYNLTFDNIKINANSNSIILGNAKQYVIIRNISNACLRNIKLDYGLVLELLSNKNDKYTIIIQNQ